MNGHVIEILGKALVPLSVFGAFALCRKYLPAAPITKSSDEYSFEELDRRFRKTMWTFSLCMLGVGVLFAWSAHAALVWTNHYLAVSDGPAEFWQFPQTAIWWFFPGFGALALSYEITLQLWSLLGSRKDADLYSQWTNEKAAAQGGRYAGMDCRKMLRWLSIVVAFPIGVLTVLALHMHVSIGAEAIRDCGYAFRPCKVYPYAEAQRTTAIEGFRDRDGKFTSRAGVVLDFNNGSRWSSADMSNFQKTVDPAFADFLEKKTLLTMTSAETEDDIPPR
jgi:hypothetical protein